jgi:anaerobic glycerol-3-phosphate dehydrogenase
MERQAKQPALVEVRPQVHDLVANVEERLALQIAVLVDDADASELLYDELARVARRLDHRQG